MRSRWLVLLLMCCLPAALPAAENFCDRSGSKATPSPDGQWVANVQEEVCATPNGAAAGITVILDAVQIRVANLSEATPPVPEYAGIRITLAFCGDNPEDRARLIAHKAATLQWQKDVTAWAQRRKQDAQTAGARPPRPEEPRLAPGRCLD